MTESNASEPHSEQTHSPQDHWEKGFQEAKAAFADIGKGFAKAADSLKPPQVACDHFRQSRIEFLKGMRELIDSRIEHLSKCPQRGTRVTVD